MARTGKSTEKKISRRDAFRAQRKAQEHRNRVIWIAIATVAALGLAAILIIPNLPVNAENVKVPEARERANVDGLSVGDPNAPVKVTEYSDFNCIHCRNFWADQEESFYTNYVATGKVYFTYSPMAFISPTSFTAAEAGYCAMDQGKFWEYHDYIFANFGADFNSPMLKAIAQKVGLNQNDFNKCLDGNQYQTKVQQDLSSAQSQGINSTPTFVVNGEKTDSGNLTSVIDKYLNQN